MSDPDPTLQQPHQPTTGEADDQQPGERLDAAKVPEELPQKPVASFEHGTTEREMAEGEPLGAKLAREVPDEPTTTTAAEGTTATPIVDDADDDGRDREKELVGDMPVGEPHLDDTGQPTPPPSAEEAAVRIDRDAPGAVSHDVPAEAPDDDRATRADR